MVWEHSENSDFPWKYHKHPHIFCPASLVKFGEKWDTLILILNLEMSILNFCSKIVTKMCDLRPKMSTKVLAYQ